MDESASATPAIFDYSNYDALKDRLLRRLELLDSLIQTTHHSLVSGDEPESSAPEPTVVETVERDGLVNVVNITTTGSNASLFVQLLHSHSATVTALIAVTDAQGPAD